MKTRSKERIDIVNEQARIMFALIEQNKDKHNLKDIILNHAFPGNRSLKPDAIKLVIDHLKEISYSPNIIKIANEVLITRRLGKVKNDKDFAEIGSKPEGQASGRIVRKRDKTLSIMEKRAHTDELETEHYHAALAIEYIGSQLANVMLPDASPKVRLHKDSKTQEVTLLSTFIDDFTPIATPGSDETGKSKITPSEAWKKFQEEPIGFGKFFAANLLLGDNDLSGSNVDIKLRRIDFGQALDFVGNKSPEDLKKAMLKFSSMYTEEIFHGAEFAHEILEYTKSIDLDQARHAIKISLNNVKEAYGEDFFDSDDFKYEMKVRFGIPKEIKLTTQLIEDTIVRHIEEQKAALNKMAKTELSIAKHLETLGIPSQYISHQAINDQTHSSQQTTQHNLYNQYLTELEHLFDDKHLANVKTNADRIAQIEALQAEKGTKTSLLKYALSNGKTELAVKMSQHGFKLNKEEMPDPKNKTTLIDSNNFIRRVLSPLTQNDLKRLEIIGITTAKNLEKKQIDLSKKPSPLYLAIETGQLKLAADMIEHGFTLKQSELAKYAKNRHKKQSYLEHLGFNKKKRSKELISHKIEEANKSLLTSSQNFLSADKSSSRNSSRSNFR